MTRADFLKTPALSLLAVAPDHIANRFVRVRLEAKYDYHTGDFSVSEDSEPGQEILLRVALISAVSPARRAVALADSPSSVYRICHADWPKIEAAVRQLEQA